MTMRVERESFLATLESVAPGLSQREVLEQSSSVVFYDGKCTTYNDEIACTAKTKLNGLTGAVQAAPLIAVLKKFPDEEIAIETKDGFLVLIGKSDETGVRMDAEIMLPVKDLEQPEKWSPLPDDFCDALTMVQECAGKDLTQFATACVHFHPKWIEAFDNFQIMRHRMKMGIGEATLVKRDSVKHVATMGVTHYGLSGSWMHFKNPSGLVISCRKFDEPFADLTPFLKVEGEQIALPKGLGDATEAAEIFSKENADNNQIMVELRPGKMRLTGRGVTGYHKKKKAIKYGGKPLSFLIAPSMLRTITERYNEAVISADRLKVQGEGWVFVACLGTPEDKED